MEINISKNSLSNRRLFLSDKKPLIDFSAEGVLSSAEALNGITELSIETLKPDIVSEGKAALRITASETAGKKAHDISFRCTFPVAVDMSASPMLYFTFSAYDGDRDSRYFANVAENMYFVEKPDPLLVSESYISVTLHTSAGDFERTVQMTNYGFNRIYANFAGCELSSVTSADFRYIVNEDAPGWQGVCKLDTVYSAMAVDLTFKGKGLERLFTAKNGKVKHDNDILSYRFGEDSSLTLPDLTDAENTVCDAFLPIKNTVVMAISATCDCMPLKVEFKTDEENFFSDEKSKIFMLNGLNKIRTVYFNFSDNKKAVGRLTGLRISPIGIAGRELSIYKVAFEQEHIIRRSSGRFVEILTDGDKVYASFKVTPEYAGKTVEIYRVYPQLIHDSTENNTPVASGIATGETQTLVFPNTDGKISLISSQFMGVVRDGDECVYFESRELISNWFDFCGGNPYAFDLPENEFIVTDEKYGALGDGFHDDTKAIQRAIDVASASGGGKVTVPGNGSAYGKRYIVTNLVLRSNVELHICGNAILWQADDLSMYDRLPRFGHNVSMTGINWPANHTCGNYPLIYAFREQNIKLTGPGTIRMCDTESRSEDGLFSFIGDNVCIGCCDRLHVTPVGIIECENIEVSNIKIIRSSATYLNLNENERGFFGNIFMDESKCTGADGMWPLGSNGMKFTRIMLNNNDDGICMSSNYNDPRDVLWNFAYPGTDRGTHNIELSHSYFNCHTFTASAVSFCTWGTDGPELELQEVSDIHIFDTSLEGRVSVGGWTDNPYFGICPFNGSETDDFSPVKNVRIHNCDLRSPLGLNTLRITNFENDFGFNSPSDFEYGNFTRREAERLPYWTTGLANWSYTTKAAVRQINLLGVNCAMIKPIRGKVCDLYQGLYLEKGKHVMSFDYKGTGFFDAFVRNVNDEVLETKEYYAEKASYIKGTEFKTDTFEFTVSESGLYRIGLSADFDKANIVYATNFKMDQK